MRRLLLATLALGFAYSTTAGASAMAAPCKDAKGKFVKCAVVAKPKKCRDAKGKFAKCSVMTPVVKKP